MSRISQKEAKELCQNFIDKKSPEMDRLVGKEDANAIWFEINDLEDYLNYAKSEASKQNKTLNGLRVYLGSYNENHDDSDKAGMTTVFLSATIDGNKKLGDSEDLNAEAFNYGNNGHPPRRSY